MTLGNGLLGIPIAMSNINWLKVIEISMVIALSIDDSKGYWEYQCLLVIEIVAMTMGNNSRFGWGCDFEHD